MRFVKSIKFRLTIWYLVVLGALLVVFGVAAYFMLSHSLYQSLDDSLKLRGAQLEGSLEVEDGSIGFQDTGQGDFGGQLGELVLLYGADGNLLQQSGPQMEITQVDTLVTQALAGHSTLVTTKTEDGQETRLYASPIRGELGIHAAVIVGRSIAEIKEVLERFLHILLFASLIVMVLAAGGGLFLANRVLKPVEDITKTARNIGSTDLSRRIEVYSDDELGRLALTLNQMIARLEEAFNRQRQFTADASHELRTPLAVIQAESTLALQKERAENDYQKSLGLISQEVVHMSALVDKLLFLARSDTAKEQLSFDGVNLKELLTDLTSEIEILCQRKGLELEFGPLENLVVKGDWVKLKQLFFNLLDNAIRYTPSGRIVSVSLLRKGESAVVAIRDSGIGIPEEDIPHIFERFYRVDKARSRAEGGAGLGLSICQHIAEVHGGKIEVESQVGEGSTFSVLLPLAESTENNNKNK
jgi:heavy metal sensor kinase